MLRPLLVCAIALCACDVFDDDEVLSARIIYAGDTANIQIPATVTRGVPFEVVIETFGGGCFSDVPAATIVDHSAGGVTVTLFDLLQDDDVCTDDIRFIRHVASVTVDVTGDVLFRFLGIEAGGGGPDRPAEVRRTVVSNAP
jgi:hypothetical protein